MAELLTLEGDPVARETGIVEIDLLGCDCLAGDGFSPLFANVPRDAVNVRPFGVWRASSNALDGNYLHGQVTWQGAVYELNGELGLAWAAALFRSPLKLFARALPFSAAAAGVKVLARPLAKIRPGVHLQNFAKGALKAQTKLFTAPAKMFKNAFKKPTGAGAGKVANAIQKFQEIQQQAEQFAPPPADPLPPPEPAPQWVEPEPQPVAQAQASTAPQWSEPEQFEPPYEEQDAGQYEEPSAATEQIMNAEELENAYAETLSGSAYALEGDVVEFIPDVIEARTLSGEPDFVPVNREDLLGFAPVMRRYGVPVTDRGGLLVRAPGLAGERVRIALDGDLAGDLGLSLFNRRSGSTQRRNMLAQNVLALATGNRDLIAAQALRNVSQAQSNQRRREQQRRTTRTLATAAGIAAGGAAIVLTGGAGLAALPALKGLGAGALGIAKSALGSMGSIAGLAKTIGVGGFNSLVSMVGQGGLQKISSVLGSGGFGQVLDALGPEARKLATPEGLQSLLGTLEGRAPGTNPQDILAQLLPQLAPVPLPAEELAKVTKGADGAIQNIEFAPPERKDVTASVSAQPVDVLIIAGVAFVIIYASK